MRALWIALLMPLCFVVRQRAVVRLVPEDRGRSGFRGRSGIAEIGAVYLGAAVIAAASPTPGGLGAIEAALVAGLTGIGVPPGPAVSAVLTYRLATYWLPVLPGWLCLRFLQKRQYV